MKYYYIPISDVQRQILEAEKPLDPYWYWAKDFTEISRKLTMFLHKHCGFKKYGKERVFYENVDGQS